MFLWWGRAVVRARSLVLAVTLALALVVGDCHGLYRRKPRWFRPLHQRARQRA